MSRWVWLAGSPHTTQMASVFVMYSAIASSCGIGSNGHLAFNDPPADLNDPSDVKVVKLDAACRQQQVDDRCFDRFGDVPTHALTLTIPRLLAADRIFCCVPGAFKK